MNKRIDKLIEYLKRRGYRDSRLKRKIIELIFLNKKPISVPEIIKKFDVEKVHYNKSSLYREIKKLLAEDILIEINLLDGKKRYELNNYIRHHHALCTKCGAVICVDISNNLDEVEKKLFEQKGFKTTEYILEFFGQCKNCQNQQHSTPNKR